MAIEHETRGRDIGAGQWADWSPDRRENGRGARPGAPWDDRMARALGWFSVALGIAEIAAPRELGRMIGVRGNETVLRALGVREVASGVGILLARRPAGWLWSRVGGDVMDLALIGTAITRGQADQRRAAAAAAAVAGVTAMDLFYSQRLSRRAGEAIHVKKTVTVNRKAEELYRAWHDIESLPRFMSHLQSVRVSGPKRSHWIAKGPGGTTVEWDAEIIDERPNELIAWQSLPGADVYNTGSVRFRRAPGGRGTEVTVELEYKPPASAAGAAIAQLFGAEPGQQIQEDIRRFKQIMEAGEVSTTEGQPSGPASNRVLSAVLGRRRRRS